MMLHEINAGAAACTRRRKRVGRGESSGAGKTCGRGHKGAGQRAGTTGTALHEGGRLPYFRRIPKRGFSNARFRDEVWIVNLDLLNRRFDAGQTVDPAALVEKRIIDDVRATIKVLAAGQCEKALTVKAHKFSAAASEKIKAAGGTVEVLPQV